MIILRNLWEYKIFAMACLLVGFSFMKALSKHPHNRHSYFRKAFSITFPLASALLFANDDTVSCHNELCSSFFVKMLHSTMKLEASKASFF